MQHKTFLILSIAFLVSNVHSMDFLKSYKLPFNNLPDIHKMLIGFSFVNTIRATVVLAMPLAIEYIYAPTEQSIKNIWDKKTAEQKAQYNKIVNKQVNSSDEFVVCVNKARKTMFIDLLAKAILYYMVLGGHWLYLKRNY